MYLRAVIRKDIRKSVQAGVRTDQVWLLEFECDRSSYLDEFMGWVGSSDTVHQVRLCFSSLDAAECFAKNNNLEYEVVQHRENSRPVKSYADNFRNGHRGVL